jgi:hypothetical protein
VPAAGDGAEHADLNRASLLQDRATACQPGRFFEVRGADEAGGSNFCNKQAGQNADAPAQKSARPRLR